MDQISEGPNAENLFTGRASHMRRFVADLNEIEPPNQIRFLRGDAGFGKSLVLRHLRNHCCKRFSLEKWNYVRTSPDVEFFEHVDKGEGTQGIAASLIDFADPARDGFESLQRLRDELLGNNKGDLKFFFPRFHYACLRMLHLEKRLTRDSVREVVPAGELGFALELMEFVSDLSIPFLRAVMELTNRHAAARVASWSAKSRLSIEDGEAIDGYSSRQDLRNAMPALFARDMNDVLRRQNQCRVALLFDSHDELVSTLISAPDRDLYARDEWLRMLLTELDLRLGFVVWVSGRCLPRWERAPRSGIAANRLKVISLNAFTNTEAREYLAKVSSFRGEGCKAIPTELEESVVQYASIGTNEIHPQLLGLCADLVDESYRKKKMLPIAIFSEAPGLERRRQELLTNLLSVVDQRLKHAVYALAAPRAFDLGLYQKLGEKLLLAPSRQDFMILTRFSFVRPAPGSPSIGQLSGHHVAGRFQIHAIVRRLLEEQAEATTAEAHTWLERYFREQAPEDPKAAAEAIFHANRIDPHRSVAVWMRELGEALDEIDLERIEAFLGVEPMLSVPDAIERGQVLIRAGDAFDTIGRREDAIDSYHAALAPLQIAVSEGEPRAHFLIGLAEWKRAMLLKENRDFVAAVDAIRYAENAFSNVDDLDLLRDHRALVLLGRAEIQCALEQSEKAESSYQQSFDAFLDAIRADPWNVDIAANYAGALISRATWANRLNDRTSVSELCKMAIFVLTIATRDFSNVNRAAANNIALAYVFLGRIEAEDGNRQVASNYYKMSAIVLSNVMGATAAHPTLQETRAQALEGLAQCMADENDVNGAISIIDKAISDYESAARTLPSSCRAHFNHGVASYNKAGWQQRFGDQEGAIATFREAKKNFEIVLGLDPTITMAEKYLEQVKFTLVLLGGLEALNDDV